MYISVSASFAAVALAFVRLAAPAATAATTAPLAGSQQSLDIQAGGGRAPGHGVGGLTRLLHHPRLQPRHLRVVADHVPQRPLHEVLLLAPGELVTPARVGVGEEEPVPGPQRLELPPDEAAEGRA